MSNFPKNVIKYLDKQEKVYPVYPQLKAEFNFIINVPSISELANIMFLINSAKLLVIPDSINPLLLITINNSDNASEEIRENNKNTITLIKRFIDEKEFPFGLAIVDASSPGNEVPEKFAGAGMARKIGMDTALRYFDYSLDGKKILANTDADCIIEENYITEISQYFNIFDWSAAVVNYEHRVSRDEEVNRAIINYELFLRYYILGLITANSPYSYHSVGSTMICDHEAYIKIDGMNKKKAGEDFYFLQKLAKVTTVNKIMDTTVYPSSRPSWRVPFGTGQRVNRFLAQEKNEFVLFDPKTFLILKEWLELYKKLGDLSPQEILDKSFNIHLELGCFLNKNNFLDDFENIVDNAKSQKQLEIQKTHWFDGFKTMKLIHHLRDTAFPEIPMFKAIDRLLNINNLFLFKDTFKGKIPPLNTQLEYLTLLREIA